VLGKLLVQDDEDPHPEADGVSDHGPDCFCFHAPFRLSCYTCLGLEAGGFWLSGQQQLPWIGNFKQGRWL